MKKARLKHIYNGVFLFLALVFIFAFGGSKILKAYIEMGIGSCRDNPMLCMVPGGEIRSYKGDTLYLSGLVLYRLPGMTISLPRGFLVVKEAIKKPYYKKRLRKSSENAIYLLQQKEDFFLNLFPSLRKKGIKNNYDFLYYTMHATPDKMNSLTDAFFMIMKAIFTPDLGRGKDIRMTTWRIGEVSGFINYNLASSGNYFDCNIVDGQGVFYKIYIKDKACRLNLDKVLMIISSIKKTG
ncbi:MAG: hypothetical protein WC510_04985 [Candidatus Omnitrophota bacterium]